MTHTTQPSNLTIAGNYHAVDKDGKPSWITDWSPEKFQLALDDLNKKTNERDFIENFLIPALDTSLPGFVLEIPWGHDGPDKILFNKSLLPAIWYIRPGGKISYKDLIFVCSLKWNECVHWDEFLFQSKALKSMLERYSVNHGDEHPAYRDVCTAMQAFIKCLQHGL